MKTISTFNPMHLGDNLIHLHFLRKLAQRYPEIQFTHGAPDQYLAQLAPLAWDLPNLSIQSIASTGQGAINGWRGAGGWFYQQPDQWDFLQTHLRWFRHLASLMGLESPIACARDMLFDYPALSSGRGSKADGGFEHILIINSPPLSGQWSGFNTDAFDRLAVQLYRHGHHVVTTSPVMQPGIPCTRDESMDVTTIGRLSTSARAIIGCVTGPMWPCLNIWNADTVALRIHLLDHERVELAPNTVHANCLSLVPEILRERGLL